MNIRNIFNKNEKIIDKFFENRKDKIIKSTNLKLDEIKEKNNNIKLEYEENFNKDKKIIIKSFLDGKLSIKDYETDKILDEYLKYIDNQDNIKENKEEIDCYLKKLLNNLLEYKNYLKFNYIFEDLKNKYKERQDILNKFNELKKELIVKEKELNKISKKINKKGIFNKNNKKEENEIQYNKKVIDIKELYKEIDKYDSYIKIIKNLNDSSTIYEVLNYASQFYQYLSEIIILNEETILSEDIDVRIEELRAFLKNPNNIIINNIAILEEKDIPIIIADIYKLSNLKVEKQDIINNLNALIESLQKLKNNYYIEKSKISIEDIKFICGFKKIMK